MLMRVCMQVVQLGVKCMPLRFRRYLREQPRLAYLYTAWLCRTKLHPSVNTKIAVGNSRHQSVEKGNALYAACMAHHNSLLAEALTNNSAGTEVKRKVDTCLVTFDQTRFVHHEGEQSASDIVRAQNYELNLLSDTIKSIHDCVESPANILVICSNKSLVKIANQVCKTLKHVSVLASYNAQKSAAVRQLGRSPVFTIQHGNLLHQHCFVALNRASISGDYAYVDTDKIEQGERFDPAFFPDWNPDLQLSTGYVKNGLLFCQSNENNGQAQLNDLFAHDLSIQKMLSALYLNNVDVQVSHIPFVLVHSQSLVKEPEAPLDTSVYFALGHEPLVSLIIPTYNGLDILRPCISSILEKTTYSNYEICIVNNRSDDPSTLEYLEEIQKDEKVTVLDYPHPFNYSAINNFAAAHTSGDVIALVNNDIEVINPEWLSLMTTHVMRPDVGCVGAKLLYSNKLVQHAGVVMGYGGGAGHAHKYLPEYRPGYLQRAIATQNYSAVTAACLLVTREDFESAGKLNETDLTVAFNDVDFCLSVLELGRRNVMVAEAVLYHHESISRGHEDTLEKQTRFQAEVRYMQTKWAKYIQHDPAYNPNLTLTYENFSIRENLEKIPL